jgi:hypothetical protein
MAKRYARVSKGEKSRMLDELCELTGWSRRHARRTLVQPTAVPRPQTTRPRIYGLEVLGPLRFVWATLGGPAGKRLAPFMAEVIGALERHGEIELVPDVRDKLLSVSAATIDRMLAPERAKLRMKGRSGTKPGSILRRQIPPNSRRSTSGSTRPSYAARSGGARTACWSSSRPRSNAGRRCGSHPGPPAQIG